MKIIKATRVYAAALPNAATIQDHLEELTFTELLSSQYSTTGFVPVPGAKDGNLVTKLDAGYAFALRFDEKIVPAASVKAEVAKRAEQIAADEGFKPDRQRLRELREIVFSDMVKVALHKTTIVPCFYDTTKGYLFVATVSQKLADMVMRDLVRAVGSVETRTIHIDNLKNGLTSRLKDQLFAELEKFGSFELTGSYWLREGNEKVSIELTSDNDEPLRKALEAGLQVEALRLLSGPVEFKLSSDFVFRGITFAEPEGEPQAFESMAEAWLAEASLQLVLLTGVIADLCELLGYQPPKAD